MGEGLLSLSEPPATFSSHAVEYTTTDLSEMPCRSRHRRGKRDNVSRLPPALRSLVDQPVSRASARSSGMRPERRERDPRLTSNLNLLESRPAVSARSKLGERARGDGQSPEGSSCSNENGSPQRKPTRPQRFWCPVTLCRRRLPPNPRTNSPSSRNRRLRSAIVPAGASEWRAIVLNCSETIGTIVLQRVYLRSCV